MPDTKLTALTAATAATGGTIYGEQSAASRRFTLTAAGAAVIEAANAAAQRTALGVATANQSMYVNAAAMIPRTTTGCGVNSLETSTNKVNYDTLDFDAGTVEYAQFLAVLPSNWNGGTVTAQFLWTAQSGSGDVVWKLAGRALSNDDAIDTAMGTAQSATDTLTAAGDMNISPATSAITIAGSPAAGVPVMFEVCRDATAGGDTLAVDANLLGIIITFTAA